MGRLSFRFACKLCVYLIIFFSLFLSQIAPSVQAAKTKPDKIPVIQNAIGSNTAEGPDFPQNFLSQSGYKIDLNVDEAAVNATAGNCLNDYCVFLPFIIKSGSPVPSNGPDLAITISDSNVSVDPGETVVYVLSYVNNGPVDSSGVTLSGILPGNTFFNSSSSTSGWQQVGTSRLFTLAVGALSVGQSGQATFAITVPDPAPQDMISIQTSVSIQDDGTHGGDPNISNNNATESTPVIPPANQVDLAVSISDGDQSVVPGEKIVYELTYFNTGSSSASGVVLTESLPDSTSFDASASTAGWQQVGTANQYTFTIGDLASNGNGTAMFAVIVANPVVAGIAAINNVASIADDGLNGADADPANNASSSSTTLVAQPDLTLSKDDGGQPVLPGATLVYDLAYSNVGNQGATGVLITETLPENTTFDISQSSTGWQQVGTTNQYQFTVGALASGVNGSAEFAVTVTGEPPYGVTNLSNTAFITDDAANGTDPNGDNNTAEKITSIIVTYDLPDLSVSQQADQTTIVPGDTIVYTIEYANAGTEPASGSVLTSTLPVNTTFNLVESDASWQQIGSTNQYTYTIGELGEGGSGSTVLVVDVIGAVSAGVAEISHIVTITDDGTHGVDKNVANNTNTLSIPLTAQPDLSLAVNDGGQAAVPGATLSYTIDYQNNGNQGATGAVLSATLPENTTFDAANSTAGWQQVGASSQYQLTIGGLNPAASGTASFAVTVANSVPAGLSTLSGSFSIFDDGLNGSDPTPANNSVSTSTIVDAAPDLSLTKSDGGLTSVIPGAMLTYTLSYANVGNQGATGVTLTETLPENTTFDAAHSTVGWQQIGTTSQYLYTAGSLSAGGNGTAMFAVTITSTPPAETTSVANSAVISDDGANGVDPISTNNTATTTTALYLSPDLSLTKTGTALVQPGTEIVYTLSYSNQGYTNATGVVVTETVPANTTFDAATSSAGWQQVGATDQYQYTIGNVDRNASGQVVFAVTVNASLPAGTTGISNTASIADDGSHGADQNNANNTANYTSMVSSGPTNVCGTISTNTTWAANMSPYVLTCDVTVSSGVTLTVEPGTVVKFNSASRRLVINGTLNAIGTASDRIYFTSYRDDAVGGDTNGDGSVSSPAGGNWSTMYVSDTGQANFNNAVIRYGGYSSTYYANLYLTQNAQVTVSNSVIANSSYYGIRVYNTTAGKNSRLTVANSTIEGNANRGVYVYTTSSGISQVAITGTMIRSNGGAGFETNSVAGLTFTGNQLNNNNGYAAYLNLNGNPVPDLIGITASGNNKNGIALVGPFTQDSALTFLPDVPYIMPNSWTINAGVTLTVPAGQVVKAELSTTSITVNGSLIARGTEDARVSFTSFKDDSLAGDTNNNNETNLPISGDWYGITVPPGGDAIFEYSAIQYAGNTASTFAALVNVSNGGSLTLNNSNLSHSSGYGIRVTGIENQSLIGNSITDCANYGVYFTDDEDGIPLSPFIRGNSIHNTASPVYLAASADGLTINQSISENTGDGNVNNRILMQGNFVGVSVMDASNDFYYYLAASATVATGSSLEFLPGSVVKFGPSGSSNLIVYGTLSAQGTSDNPILFTSVNDGEGRTPSLGNWRAIVLQNTGKANFDHAIFRYGYYPIELVNGTDANQPEVVVTNSIFENYAYGVYVNTVARLHIESNSFTGGEIAINITDSNNIDDEALTSVLIKDNVINNASNTAIIIQGNTSIYETRNLQVEDISGNSGAGNGKNIILFNNVNFVGQSYLSTNDLVYRFTASVVELGSSLTLAEGSVVKFHGTSPLTIRGILNISGADDHPVIVTSMLDDTYGGDSNGDGGATQPASGNWSSISIINTGKIKVDHAIFRYGSKTITLTGTVVPGPEATIINSLFEYSIYGVYSDHFSQLQIEQSTFEGLNYGIYTTASNEIASPSRLILRNNTINNSTNSAIRIGGNLTTSGGYSQYFHYRYLQINDISGNTGSGNGENSINLYIVAFVGTSNLSHNDLAYNLRDPRIEAGAVLTINPGSVLKQRTYSNYGSADYSNLTVNGSLVAVGTKDDPIVFTSFYDDEFGGDTNSDGSTTQPAKANWGGIFILGNGIARISNAVIQYGTGGSSCVILPCTFGGMINYSGQEFVLENSVISNSQTYGILIKAPNHVIVNNTFRNLNSAFEAVFNGDPENLMVSAENNDWGSPDGPKPYGEGYGINYKECTDPVTREKYACEFYVDADPWLGKDIATSQDLIDAELPDEPFRNIAEMEPGVPYIEYVKSRMGFFYFGNETSDKVEIRVDWNGSDPGRGEPGVIKVSADKLGGWTNQIIANTDENGGVVYINPQVLGLGFSELKYQAFFGDVDTFQSTNASKIFVSRATRFIAPQWLTEIKVNGIGMKVTYKPEYTEATFSAKLPAQAVKVKFGKEGIPFVEKTKMPDIELKFEMKIRSDGHGEFTGEVTSDIEVWDAGKVEADANVRLNTSGTVQLPASGQGLSLEGGFGGSIGGEITYEESLLVVIPGIGAAVKLLGNVPGLDRILNALYVEAKIEPEVGLNTSVEADIDAATVEWKGLTINGTTKITLTVGMKLIEDVIEANVYGGGEVSMDFCLDPQLEWEKTNAELFVGAEVKALSMFEAKAEKRWEYEIPNQDANCGAGMLSTAAQSQAGVEQSLVIDESTTWQVESPDYAGAPYAQFYAARSRTSTQTAYTPKSVISDSLIISNLYKSAAPAIVASGNNAVLVWVHDDLSLSDTQSKELMASVWQGSAWSASAQITDNQYVDFNAQLAFIDAQHVLAVWQQIKDSTISADATLTPEIGQKVELVYSIYNLLTNTWTAPAYLTGNDMLDHRPRIMVGQDGAVMVAWVQNASGDLVGSTESPDSIRYVRWDGSAWTEGEVLPANVTSLLSFDGDLHQANQGILVLSRITEGDFSSLAKVELFYTQWDGSLWSELVQLTLNNVADESPSVGYTTSGGKRLIWLRNNQLVMLGDDWTAQPSSAMLEDEGISLRSFESAVDDEDNIAVIWQGVSRNGSDLFYSIYDTVTQTWKTAEQLTNSLAVEKQISVSFDGSGQLMIAYALDNVAPKTVVVDGIPINNVMQYQSTDLHVLYYTPDSDLSITSLSLPYRPNPEPGETVTVQALLANSGDWSIENPSVSFYDGNPDMGGTLIDTYNHIGFLKAGESVKVNVQWMIPAETIAPKTLFAVADQPGLILEEDETNNIFSLTTVLPDLSVSSVNTYYYDQHRVVPLAVIYNTGKLKAENVVVEFREGSENGQVVYSETVPLIEKEGMVAVSTEIDVYGWASDNYEYYVTIDSADSIHEFDESNNGDYFSISILPDLVIYSGDIVATLDPDTGGTVNVTVRNWGASNATNVHVNLYEGPDIDMTRTPVSTWEIPLLTVDGQVTVSTTIDHIPNHLFAVADPSNDYAEIDESNNVGYELLPIVNGSQVFVVGSSDPNLADIIVTYPDFEAGSGRFTQGIQGLLYDVTQLGQVNNLCDISTVGGSIELQGKIALVEKGNCEYAVQVNNATTLGAIAILIYNDAVGGNQREVICGGVVGIPAGFLPRQDGLDLMIYHNWAIEIKSESEAITILDPYR